MDSVEKTEADNWIVDWLQHIPNISVGDVINDIILILLAIATLLFVLEKLGFLPRFMRKLIAANRAAETLDVLRDLGVDVDRATRSNISASVSVPIGGENTEESVNRKLEHAKIDRKIDVGDTVPVRENQYYDFMGLSTTPANASAMARDLASFWRRAVENKDIRTPQIDFVVTPKTGSPILGYEFSKVIGRPFTMHNPKEKFRLIRSANGDCRAVFDVCIVPEQGATALLVDDSSTGGGKAIRAVEDLKKYGFKVTDMIVLFAPSSKKAESNDAKSRLAEHSVSLHHVVET